VAELITKACGYNPTLRAVAVLNFADAQSAGSEAAAEALSNAGAIEFLDCPGRKSFATPRHQVEQACPPGEY
jgi:hypothetical protein